MNELVNVAGDNFREIGQQIKQAALQVGEISKLLREASAKSENEAYCEQSGYTRDELRCLNIADIIADEAPEKTAANIARIQAQGSACLKLQHRRKEGTLFDVEISMTLLPKSGGQMIGFCRDISERKQAEEALSDRESRLRAITDSTQDAVLMMDPDGCISYWNPAATMMLGYSREECLGMNLHQLLASQRYHAAHTEGFAKFKQTGEGNAVHKTLELSACHKDGHELSVELSLSSIQMKNGWHAVGIIRDITERKQAEEEIRSNRARYQVLMDPSAWVHAAWRSVAVYLAACRQ